MFLSKILLCSFALVSAGIIGTDYSPATSVSYSSISTPIGKTISNPVYEKISSIPIGYTKIVQSPPVYQSILTTKESNFENLDGTQHATYTKSLDTAYSSLKKFDSKATKDGDAIANTPIFYHSGPAYTPSSPIVHTIHSPALTKSVFTPTSYTTHDVPLTNTIAPLSITSYKTPDFDKTRYVSSGLSFYSSNSPDIESQPIKTTLSYSDAPIVRTIHTPALTKSVSVPISYTTHDAPLTKNIALPSSTPYSTSEFDKTRYDTSGLSSYSSNPQGAESQPIKTTITFSEAPLVSHMTFTGLGTSYAW